MALVSMKPTSAGRRHMVKVVHPELHKGKPYAPLVTKKNRINGRDNYGHITTRHKGGGHKRAYRIIDFLRNKDGIVARVERLEYDPNRTAHIALVLYADGERRYIIAPKGLKVGSEIVSGSDSAIKVGNCLPLRNIPVGTTICCVELFPGKGAQIARAAGSYAQLIAREGEYAQVRMRSGEVRRIGIECRATIGTVSNDDHNLEELGIYPLKLIAVDKNGNSVSKDVAVEVVEEPVMDPYLYWSYDEIVSRLSASGVGVGGDAYAIAESLIGMGGYCTDVANTFLALYYGDGSNCFDTYDIDPANAQPGDVVFYSDGGTGYQHYAIYLGGEMSLQGNWLGTTVIRSVYINGSAPQFRRCSGH